MSAFPQGFYRDPSLIVDAIRKAESELQLQESVGCPACSHYAGSAWGVHVCKRCRITADDGKKCPMFRLREGWK